MSLEQRIAALEAIVLTANLRGLNVTQTRAIFSNGDPVFPLGTAASTDTPDVGSGLTVVRFHINGSTIVQEVRDTTNGAWRSATLS